MWWWNLMTPIISHNTSRCNSCLKVMDFRVLWMAQENFMRDVMTILMLRVLRLMIIRSQRCMIEPWCDFLWPHFHLHQFLVLSAMQILMRCGLSSRIDSLQLQKPTSFRWKLSFRTSRRVLRQFLGIYRGLKMQWIIFLQEFHVHGVCSSSG